MIKNKEAAELTSWFALKSVFGVGNSIFKKLIERFGSPQKVFEASEEELLQVKNVKPSIASVILKNVVPDKVKKEIELLYRTDFKIVTITDLNYPELLLRISDPPPFLYVYGNLEPTSPNIAFVGSRRPTEYGINTTVRMCKEMSSLGFTIVSGMAKGIDTKAHEGALLGSGKTVAILGSGLSNIYPRENIKLFYEIAERGAVISEFPLKTEPEAHNFPIRNRIISGLCLGTVVVEAALNSGSLITASIAVDQNREVFAVPGNITSYKSFGAHRLIKQGAKLVTNIKDILEELPQNLLYQNKQEEASAEKEDKEIFEQFTEEEAEIFNLLSAKPIHIDDLVGKLSFDTSKLLSILLTLELKGAIKKIHGNYFKKN
ncbi:MAG: DNA-protecting protein DprA [Deltaproteobacteria bacterium]|nr:DNA-protecting protein DprA [Deltaproteobacteria bacterium]